MDRNDQEMQACIERCQECHEVCVATLFHCLAKGGDHARPAHVRLMLDCAEICQTSANFMLRGSELHRLTCGACSEVCLRCADDCDRLGEDDETMRACADVCRRCSDSCARMAAGG